MNAKKAKLVRKLFPRWNEDDFVNITTRKIIRNPDPFEEEPFISVTRVTRRLRPFSDASSYRRIKKNLPYAEDIQ